MSKTPLVNPINIYYAALAAALVLLIVSGGVLVHTLTVVTKRPQPGTNMSMSPQEQTLTKVLDLLENNVLQKP